MGIMGDGEYGELEYSDREYEGWGVWGVWGISSTGNGQYRRWGVGEWGAWRKRSMKDWVYRGLYTDIAF